MFRSISKYSSRALMLPILATAALLTGCATATTYEAMVPTAYETGKKHQGSVSIAVTGGQETEATGKPQISNDAFTKALTEAITKSQTFTQVAPGKGGNYLLSVSLISLEQPSFGLTFTVKMEAGWTLKRANGQTVWQESIKSQHTATTSDAFAAVTRLRLATEGAARNNIAQGLAKISKLNL